MDKDIEQYKILWDSLNNEMHRFWVRYNVLVTIQIGVFSYFFKDKKNIEELVNIQSVLIIIFLLIVSLITWKIVNRAINVYKLLINGIKKFEKGSHSKLNIVANILEQRAKMLASPYAYRLALVIPYIFFIFCLAALIFIIDNIKLTYL